MTGKTHALCGMTTMTALTVLYPTGFTLMEHTLLPAVGLVTAAAGSYAPDIDIHRSKLGQKHKFISKHLTHRGITHTLLAPAVLTVLMLTVLDMGIPVLPDLIFGFTLGWVLHIVADLFNKKGVPILWPVVRQKIHIATVLTSSWQEGVFAVLWIGVHIVWVLSQLR